MDKNHTFKLIEGEFDAFEALELIQDFYFTKIKFHNRTALNQELRGGKVAAQSKKRLEELQETRKNVAELIRYARNNNIALKIKSNIEVELIQ